MNFDGLVNIFDINLLSSNWSSSDPAVDVNNDGTVNIVDVNWLSSHWSSAGTGSAAQRTADATPAPSDAPPEVQAVNLSSNGTRSNGAEQASRNQAIRNALFSAYGGDWHWDAQSTNAESALRDDPWMNASIERRRVR